MRTQLLQNRAVQGQENLALASVSPAAVRGERAWSPHSRISARHISPPKKFRLESKGFLYVRNGCCGLFANGTLAAPATQSDHGLRQHKSLPLNIETRESVALP